MQTKTLDDLQTEYMKLVAEYGDRHFRIVRETKAIKELEAKMAELDAEYLKLPKETKTETTDSAA
jgi:hypothetical protein